MGLLGQGLFGYPPTTDDYYKNLASDAMIQGQQAETAREQEQQMIQAQQQQMINERAQQALLENYVRNIQENKLAYEAAAGNAEAQAAAHERADIWRNDAKQNGIDLSAIEGMNANQLGAYGQTLRDNAKNLFLHAETPDEVMTRIEQENLNNGMGKRAARDDALRKAKAYQATYIADATRLFGQQGISNNAINSEIGLPLLMMMSYANPESVALPASMLAHPVDDYKQDWAREQAYMAADIANNRAILGNNLAIARDNNNFNNSMVMSNEKFDQALAINRQKQQMQMEMADFMSDLGIRDKERSYQLMERYPWLINAGSKAKESKGSEGLTETELKVIEKHDEWMMLHEGASADKSPYFDEIQRIQHKYEVPLDESQVSDYLQNGLDINMRKPTNKRASLEELKQQAKRQFPQYKDFVDEWFDGVDDYYKGSVGDGNDNNTPSQTSWDSGSPNTGRPTNGTTIVTIPSGGNNYGGYSDYDTETAQDYAGGYNSATNLRESLQNIAESTREKTPEEIAALQEKYKRYGRNY